MTKTPQKIVVIGAGIGGLSAAIRLAAAGQEVTLIETQLYPGGKMRCLPSAAGPIDAGPTVLTLRTVFDDLFALVGERMDDHLTLRPHPMLARHWWPDGSRLDLFANADQSAEAIADFAGPRAAAEFRRFHRQTEDLFAAFDHPMLRSARPNLPGLVLNTLCAPSIWPALQPGRSLARHLAATFTDPRLRQLFGRYATYVGGVPDLSPAVLALIWQAEAKGVWSVQGGMHLLAQALANLARRAGVSVSYGVSARKILKTAGRVSEVALSDGRSIKCDAVVFNGDPAALLAGLMGNGPQLALAPVAAHPRSLSAWVWSFAAIPSPIDLAHHNVFFGADPTLEFGAIAQGKMPTEATLYVCAQDRTDAPLAPDSLERFEIIMNGPAKTKHSLQEISECRAKT
ncbi:MAG: FAD-dependent oxidoreductase, partial [Gemmobacter sp.]|nr:FAD-dependent oxidoreductase [Gemmobacter sp.]